MVSSHLPKYAKKLTNIIFHIYYYVYYIILYVILYFSLQDDCRETAKIYHLYFAESVKRMLMTMDSSQAWLWETALVPQSRSLENPNLMKQIY